MSGRQVVATNGKLHPRILEELRRAEQGG
jgi:hypothetical protein